MPDKPLRATARPTAPRQSEAHPAAPPRSPAQNGRATTVVSRHPAARVLAQKKRVLGMFSLAMIDVAAVISLRNLPTIAEYGWGSIFIFALALLGFMIPISFAAAELGSGWPKAGGVYTWVKEAFGEKQGSLAIWADWAQSLVWYPTVLAFIGAALAYVIVPSWANNKWWLFAVMMVVFWATTLANFLGARDSARISTWGSLAGSIFPGVVLILLGLGWLLSGRPLAAPYSGAHSLVPSLNLTNLVFFSGVLLAFSGMEMAGFSADSARNPKKDIPRATLLACVVLVVIYVLGTLAIAFVVPPNQIDLHAGLFQAFQVFFDKFGVGWLLRPMSLLVFVGGIALLSTWMYGPAKGFMRASAQGDYPKVFQRHNNKLAPTGVLLIQAGIGTLFSLLFLFEPTISTSYWILSALTTQLLVIMYVLMLAALIRLRYTQPDTPRPYQIPGGKLGVWIVGGFGIAGCSFAFFLGFVPPSQLATGNHTLYVCLMVAFTALLAIPPFLFARFRKPGWRDETFVKEIDA
jgi:glutamate:GABA antiporter